jgi:hypothetical protein
MLTIYTSNDAVSCKEEPFCGPNASDVVTQVHVCFKSGLKSDFDGLGIGLGLGAQRLELGLGLGTVGLGLGL